MKNISRKFVLFALTAILTALGFTACQKSDSPPDQSTNAAPEKKPDHPEHPKK